MRHFDTENEYYEFVESLARENYDRIMEHDDALGVAGENVVAVYLEEDTLGTVYPDIETGACPMGILRFSLSNTDEGDGVDNRATHKLSEDLKQAVSQIQMEKM